MSTSTTSGNNSSTTIVHSPVNDFNATQVQDYMNKAFEQSLGEAQSSKATLYKPTSGGWTTPKPSSSSSSSSSASVSSSAATARVLNELIKSGKNPGGANVSSGSGGSGGAKKK